MNRWLLPVLCALLVMPLVAMATGTLTVPINFGSYTSGVHNLSDLDTNFAAVTTYINAREITQATCATRPAAGVSGRLFFCTDTQTLYADTGSAWTSISAQPTYTDQLTGLGTGLATATQVLVGAGAAASDDATINNRVLMTVASATQGNTAGTWVAGNFQNKLDAGALGITQTWHMFVIQRTDTGATDILFSLSPTAPTMPTNYTKKRRVGSFMTNGAGAILPWIQDGDNFRLVTSIQSFSQTNPGGAAVTSFLNVPGGIHVFAIVNAHLSSTAAAGNALYLSDLDATDELPPATAGSVSLGAPLAQIGVSANVAGQQNINLLGTAVVRTNTLGQIRFRLALSDAATIVDIVTLGWIDRRGRG